MLFRFKDYLRGTLYYPTKTIRGIWTGVAKRLRRIYLNDSGFQKKSKKNSANLAERNNKHRSCSNFSDDRRVWIANLLHVK